ncbi:8-amino-7-oxononanoate synthase [Flexibacter flexilis DSM 6793]|uniref:8-amino-7-oxononanoate synthase n=1 Tax=Flexibacter flexilis DSM 6793 TaxID=927664 RepID=A0A1I1ITM9_9BACT|nr:8-amino-7-oxononanoate synthase [Flexibacter flexilis]SFC39271.1 8-amino-7-oxononanoate synthase [Flexibacter flexilis DSM 6793]
MSAILTRLENALCEREQTHSLRRLQLTQGIDFFSNDYLGLATNGALVEPFLQQQYANPLFVGQKHGATGSRLLSGNSAYVLQAEQYLANLFGTENALLFNSGYAANTAVLSAIPQKGDVILYDERSHASLKEGARLSFASRFSFKHNDLQDLEAKLLRHSGKGGEVFVVVETVYSMDGDIAPLPDMVKLCQAHQAHLIVDEAHSTGIWGREGAGLLRDLGLEKEVFAAVYTFGKAIGGHGACVAGADVLVQYLVNFARPFIYTTAMPLQSVAYVLAAFEYLKATPQASGQLFERIHFFREYINTLDIAAHFTESNSPIQMLKVQGGNEAARTLASNLQGKGYNLRAVLSPTVPEGHERIRICLHNFNGLSEIKTLLEEINRAV